MYTPEHREHEQQMAAYVVIVHSNQQLLYNTHCTTTLGVGVILLFLTFFTFSQFKIWWIQYK